MIFIPIILVFIVLNHLTILIPIGLAWRILIPSFIPLMHFFVSIKTSANFAIISGFFLGLLLDSISSIPLGSSSVGLIAVGYLVARFRNLLPTNGRGEILPAAILLFGYLCSFWISQILLWLLFRYSPLADSYLNGAYFLSILVNTVWGTLLFRVLSFILRKTVGVYKT